MNIQIQGLNLNLSDVSEDRLRRSIEQALNAFEQAIRDAKVRLTDVNGHKGGADKKCQVIVHLTRFGEVMAEVTDNDVAAAVDRAAQKVKLAVSRKLARKRHTKRDTLRGEPNPSSDESASD